MVGTSNESVPEMASELMDDEWWMMDDGNLT